MKTPNKKEGKQTFSYKYPSFSGPGIHSQGSTHRDPESTHLRQMYFTPCYRKHAMIAVLNSYEIMQL